MAFRDLFRRAPVEMRASSSVVRDPFRNFNSAYEWTLRQLPRHYSPYHATQFPAVKKALQRLSNDVSTLPMVVEELTADRCCLLYTSPSPRD